MVQDHKLVNMHAIDATHANSASHAHSYSGTRLVSLAKLAGVGHKGMQTRIQRVASPVCSAGVQN